MGSQAKIIEYSFYGFFSIQPCGVLFQETVKRMFGQQNGMGYSIYMLGPILNVHDRNRRISQK